MLQSNRKLILHYMAYRAIHKLGPTSHWFHASPLKLNTAQSEVISFVTQNLLVPSSLFCLDWWNHYLWPCLPRSLLFSQTKYLFSHVSIPVPMQIALYPLLFFHEFTKTAPALKNFSSCWDVVTCSQALCPFNIL